MFVRSHWTVIGAFVVGGILTLGGLCREAPASVQDGVELLEVKRIWDEGLHNAFCDIIRFNGQWYVAFRESPTVEHEPPAPGEPAAKGRIIRSQDNGQTWQSVALFNYNDQTTGVHNLSITPDNRLMASGATAWRTGGTWAVQPLVWFSNDGENWTAAQVTNPYNNLYHGLEWRADNKVYTISYGPIALMSSVDGINYSFLVNPMLSSTNCPTEGALCFRQDDSAVAFVRCDCGDLASMVGTSSGNLQTWSWKSTGIRAEGQRILELPDTRIVAAARMYDATYGFPKTSLCWLNPQAGTLEEFLVLPSGGDTSYPGLYWHDNVLWVSYYSTHEGRTSIYLAKVRIRQTVYQEIFSSGGSHRSLTFASWKLHRGPTGTAASTSLIYREVGAEIPLAGSVHSTPALPDGPEGFVYGTGAGSGYANLFWTDEYVINRQEWANMRLSWETCHDSVSEPMRAALRQDNEWFVSDPIITVSTPAWGESGRVTVEVSASAWRRLNFTPGVELSVGDPVKLDPYGSITAYGWYNEGQMGNLKFDNFQIMDAPWQCAEAVLSDLDQNCWVDLLDLTMLVSAWLDCTHPGCDQN